MGTENRTTCMAFGYARDSTVDEDETLRRDALADCEKLFEDMASGALASRPVGRDARPAAPRRHRRRVEARPAGSLVEEPDRGSADLAPDASPSAH